MAESKHDDDDEKEGALKELIDQFITRFLSYASINISLVSKL